MQKNYFSQFLLLFVSFTALAQKNVDVDLLTGTARISIPIYSVSRGGISIPATLNYASTGVKVLESESSAGMSWQLSAGGSISRQVKGLPDDCQRDNSNNAIYGWIFNTNGSTIKNFTIQNDNSSSTCQDETDDITFINNILSNRSDTEPDTYFVDAPGLSCSLVFDNEKVMRTMDNQDLKITYSFDTNYRISSFTIINDKGTKYDFALPEMYTRKISSTKPTEIGYFKYDYLQYQNGITYADKWMLTKITDATGNSVDLNYIDGTDIVVSSPLKLIYGAASNSSVTKNQYTIRENYTPKWISRISSYNNTVETDFLTFSYSEQKLFSITAANGKYWRCTYNNLTPINGGKTRAFLYSFGDNNSCESELPYYFQYSGIDFNLNKTNLPDTSSKAIDLWGYYNGSAATTLIPQIFVYPNNSSYPDIERYRINPIPNFTGTVYQLNGADRSSNSAFISSGVLTKIVYPEGGNTSFTYEPNDYFDKTANSVFQGAGIRISQLTIDDGSNTNPLTRNYSYTDPLTGMTSGKMISMPIFAFTTPTSITGTEGDLWNYSTIRSETNLSTESDYVIYSKIKVSQNGQGSTRYEFNTPATFWDPISAEWPPSTVNIGRLSCTATLGFLSRSSNSYPFPPNPNADRGTMLKSTNYNENNAKVDETTYTYQKTNPTPLTITGLEFDDNGSAKCYAKYNIYASMSESLSQQTRTVFDLNDDTKQETTTHNYYYESSAHRLVTQEKTSGSDGTINRFFTKYVKDYLYSTVTDQNSIALQGLNNQNNNMPVETYNTKEINGVQKTISARLITFKPVNTGLTSPATLYMPAQRLSFLSADGVNDFTISAISAGTFRSDLRYVTKSNYLGYDRNGYLLSSDDNNRHVNSTFTDHNYLLPIINVSNARYDEFIYSNFDGDAAEYSFQPANTAYIYTIDGRSGNSSLDMAANSSIQKTVKKNPQAKSYIFSCWLKAESDSQLSISVLNSSNQTSTSSLNYTNTLGTWKYYELKIPVTNMISDFTLSISNTAACRVDDILFYPEQSDVLTYDYDSKFHHKTAETNSNGTARYYSYDGIGRLQFVYDQDKNILEKKSYVKPNEAANGLSTPYISSVVNTLYASLPIAFSSGSNICISGITYTWDFGDGTIVSTINQYTQTHIYANPGSYNVTLTITHPTYGSKSSTQQVSVSVPPITIGICQSGVFSWDGCYHKPLEVASCNSNPEDDEHSYYTVIGVYGKLYGTLSYQWQKSINGGTWTNVGSNTTQYVVGVGGKGVPYAIRCIASTTGGQTATSINLFFDVTYCN